MEWRAASSCAAQFPHLAKQSLVETTFLLFRFANNRCVRFVCVLTEGPLVDEERANSNDPYDWHRNSWYLCLDVWGVHL